MELACADEEITGNTPLSASSMARIQKKQRLNLISTLMNASRASFVRRFPHSQTVQHTALSLSEQVCLSRVDVDAAPCAEQAIYPVLSGACQINGCHLAPSDEMQQLINMIRRAIVG